ncbi:MAG: GTPase ObgE [Kiritimatiellia bacterium]
MKTRTFIDSVTVYCLAGSGGKGCVSYHREKYKPRGGPDGGDGGRGGGVILEGDADVNSLIDLYLAPHLKAENGGSGKGNNRHGRNGTDLVVKVPCGTEVWDTGKTRMIGDIVKAGSRIAAVRGGRGGQGNRRYRRSGVRADRQYAPAGEGESATLELELKLIADAGLVGFPNAGKSSLLSCLSAARPKVAAYPFTTLNPVIGTVVFDDYRHLTVADIPGVIKDAHMGVGLGHEFLRHIERSPVFVYVLDMAGADGRDPVEDYTHLRKELDLHKPGLSDRPRIIAANKMDMKEASGNLRDFREALQEHPVPVSAATGSGIEQLKTALGSVLPFNPP